MESKQGGRAGGGGIESRAAGRGGAVAQVEEERKTPRSSGERPCGASDRYGSSHRDGGWRRRRSRLGGNAGRRRRPPGPSRERGQEGCGGRGIGGASQRTDVVALSAACSAGSVPVHAPRRRGVLRRHRPGAHSWNALLAIGTIVPAFRRGAFWIEQVHAETNGRDIERAERTERTDTHEAIVRSIRWRAEGGVDVVDTAEDGVAERGGADSETGQVGENEGRGGGEGGSRGEV
mmetsp:Transcript_9506/g.20603  ORF Transcript_9506/g.20603 Transcript_9506/m.20603 type:complete len:234 (-) Transcript_9506:635-1336(-)